jgi:hypothetical protein
MEKSAIATEHSDSSVSFSPASPASFERPAVEEISLCCEISAYAPDDDDRPLF